MPLYIYHDNAVWWLTLFEVTLVIMHINIMCLFNYVKGKPELKCAYHVDICDSQN